MNPRWPNSNFSVPPTVPVTYQSQVLQQNSWSPVSGNPLSGCLQTSDDLYKPSAITEVSSVSPSESVFKSVKSKFPVNVPPPNVISINVPPRIYHSKYLSHSDQSSPPLLPAELSPPFPSASSLLSSVSLRPLTSASLPPLPPGSPPPLPNESPPLPSESPSLVSGSLPRKKNELYSTKSVRTSEHSVNEESAKYPVKIEPSIAANESKVSIIKESLHAAHFSRTKLLKQKLSVSSPVIESHEVTSNSNKEPTTNLSGQCVLSTFSHLESANFSSVTYDQSLQHPFVESTQASEDIKSPLVNISTFLDVKPTLVNTLTSLDVKSTFVNNMSKVEEQTGSVVTLSQITATEAQKSSLSPTIKTVVPTSLDINKSFLESEPSKNTVSVAVHAAISSAAQFPVPAVIQPSLPLLQIPHQVPLQAAVPPPLSVQSSHSSFILPRPAPSMPIAPSFHLGAASDVSKGNLSVPPVFNAPLPPVRIHRPYLSFPLPGNVLQTGSPYTSYTSQGVPNEYKSMPHLWNKKQNSLTSSSLDMIQKYSENDISSSKNGAQKYSYSDERHHPPSSEFKSHPHSTEKENPVLSKRLSSVSKDREIQTSSSPRHKNHSFSKEQQFHSASEHSRHNSTSKESRHHSSSKKYRCSESKEFEHHSPTKESRHKYPAHEHRSHSLAKDIKHSSAHDKRHHSTLDRRRSPVHDRRHHSPAHDRRYNFPSHDKRYCSPSHDRRYRSPSHDRRYRSPSHDRRHLSPYRHHSSSRDYKHDSPSHHHRQSSSRDRKHDLPSSNHRDHSQSKDYRSSSLTPNHFVFPKENKNSFFKIPKCQSPSKEQDHRSPSEEIRSHSSPKQNISMPFEDKKNNLSMNDIKCDSLVKEDKHELSFDNHAYLNDLDKNNFEKNKQNEIDNISENKNNLFSKNISVKLKDNESESESKNDSKEKLIYTTDRLFEDKNVDLIQKQKRHNLHSDKILKKRERSTSITKSPKKMKKERADSVISYKSRESSEKQDRRSSLKQYRGSSQKQDRRSSQRQDRRSCQKQDKRSSQKQDRKFKRETNTINQSRSKDRFAFSDKRRSRSVSLRSREQYNRKEKRIISRYRRRRSSTPKDLPCLSLKDYKYVCSNSAEEYYFKEENSTEVIATDALKELHEKFRFELVQRAERIRASKPKYEPPKRKTKLRKPKPPKTGSESDSSSSEEKSSSEEEDTAMEELERKKKHPYRLHLELWFNDPKEMNDGPLCRCSAKARRAGIRHGIYVGEEHLPLCEPFSNNRNRLYHYRITMTPHTNFLTKNPTTISHNGHEYRFEGFSMFSHLPLPQLPNCKVIRFNYEYTILYKEEDFPQNFTVGGLELFNSYLLSEILELIDLNWKAHDDPEGCPRFHFMPRFSRELKDGGKELLSHCYVLEYLLKANQILIDEEKLPDILELDDHKWQDLADKVKGMIVTCPGMKPSSIRVDQLDREQCETDKEEFPVIVHFGVRPPQLSYAGNPYYQKAWRDYVKYRHLLANKPKVKYADRHKLMQKESRLQEMRMENDLKRDVTIVISSKNFYKTGIMSDVVQHAMLLPVLVCHLRFHDSLTYLENKIGYKFDDRYLLQLALTHPSYRENFGTNPDHARNSLTNCGLRQPQYGDRRIHYMNTRKRGINTLINIMSRFGSRKETLSRINHNERLEFLGDAVVEFLSSIHLFYMFPDLEEGGLATYRAAIVQNQHLAVLSKKLELDRFMLYAHGSDLCHDLELRHAMANCFEALMGALFLDNGIEIADKVFSKTLFTEPELLEVWKNFPPHPLQEQEPNGDRKWIESVPLLQNLHKFEEAIGIEFNHIRLLARALTHRSLGYNNLTLGSNQRLEFLGDTVLQLVASEYLYKFFPEHHEGHLSLLRSSLVNNRTQAVVCADLGMVEYAIYPYSKVELKPKDKADLLEAFLGALYVDKDLGYCRKFCEVCFFPRLQDFIMNQDWNDPKSKLQQCCLTLRSMDGGEPDIPTYKVIECKGPTNTRVYSVAVYFQGNRLAVGSGHSIQQAEMDAAGNALKKSKDLFPQLRHQRRAIERSLKKGPPKKHQDTPKDPP